MRWAGVVALAMVALCAYAAHFGMRLLPDFDLYTQGGLGMYPSPLGRLLGALGEVPFMVASVLASGLCVLLVARSSSRPALAASLFAPLAVLWLMQAGIDAIGLAVFLLAATVRPAVYVLAPLTHAVLAPYVLLELRRVSRLHLLTALFFLVPALLFALLATPYSGIVFGLLTPSALLYFVGTLLAGLALASPLFLFASSSTSRVLPFVVGAACCAAQTHVQMRYFLPAVALTACDVAAYRKPSLMSAAMARAGLWWRWNTSRGRASARGSVQARPDGAA